MVVAKIALDTMPTPTRAAVQRLASIRDNPYCGVYTDERNDNFVTASCFMDDIRQQRPDLSPWHFIDYPFSADGTASKEPAAVNILSGIDWCMRGLAGPERQQAEAMRFLEHLVGDIHQPLHCACLFSSEHPRGDKGGNQYGVVGAANLHSYWDDGGNSLPAVERPLNGSDVVERLAKEIEAEFPQASLPEIKQHPTPKEWAQESYQLATTVVYQIAENTEPSKAYARKARTLCRRRIALAGYRLAAALGWLQ